MKTLSPDIETLIEQAMQKAGERFASEKDLLAHILGNYISQGEPPEERLERTRKEFDSWIEERASTPISEYVDPPTIPELKNRYQDRLETALLEGLNSGDPIPVDEKHRDTMKEQLTKRAEAKTN